MTNPTTPTTIVEHKLRIKINHAPITQKFFMRFFYRNRFTQCVPTKLSMNFTNIGNSGFPGAVIKDFTIHSNTENMGSRCLKSIALQALNPGESHAIDIDVFTMDFKGATWLSAILEPIDPSYQIKSFHFEPADNSDTDSGLINKWGCTLYIQGELEYLQHITNSLILLLTAITVFEAIFGIKKSLLWLFHIIGVAFKFFGEFILRFVH